MKAKNADFDVWTCASQTLAVTAAWTLLRPGRPAGSIPVKRLENVVSGSHRNSGCGRSRARHLRRWQLRAACLYV